jgi:hypothetical protein
MVRQALELDRFSARAAYCRNASCAYDIPVIRNRRLWSIVIARDRQCNSGRGCRYEAIRVAGEHGRVKVR